MPPYVPGKLQSRLDGVKSGQTPIHGFLDQLSIVGDVTLNLGSYAAYNKSAPKKTVVACLAQAPVSGAGNVQSVSVIPSTVPNQVIVRCYDSANTKSTAAAKVNIIVAYGASQLG